MITINSQPDENELVSGKRPILISVISNKDVCVVEVFVGGLSAGVLKKTIKKYDSIFVFNIQNIVDEHLIIDHPIGIYEVDNYPYLTDVYCEVKHGSIDEGGHLTLEDESIFSNKFYTLPVLLDYNESSVKDKLNKIKKGWWDPDSFPLSERPVEQKVMDNSSVFFSFLTEKEVYEMCLYVETYNGDYMEFCKTLKDKPTPPPPPPPPPPLPDPTPPPLPPEEKHEYYLKIKETCLSGVLLQTVVLIPEGDIDYFDRVKIEFKLSDGKYFDDIYEANSSSILITVPFGVYDMEYSVLKNATVIEKKRLNIGQDNIDLVISFENGKDNEEGGSSMIKTISNLKYLKDYDSSSTWSYYNGDNFGSIVNVDGIDTSADIPLDYGVTKIALYIEKENDKMKSNGIVYKRS